MSCKYPIPLKRSITYKLKGTCQPKLGGSKVVGYQSIALSFIDGRLGSNKFLFIKGFVQLKEEKKLQRMHNEGFPNHWLNKFVGLLRLEIYYFVL